MSYPVILQSWLVTDKDTARTTTFRVVETEKNRFILEYSEENDAMGKERWLERKSSDTMLLKAVYQLAWRAYLITPERPLI